MPCIILVIVVCLHCRNILKSWENGAVVKRVSLRDSDTDSNIRLSAVAFLRQVTYLLCSADGYKVGFHLQ